MKYILLNDITHFLKRKKKIIFVYLMILLVYFSYKVLLKIPMDISLFYKVLTLDCEFEYSDWLNIILYVFSMSLYVYIALHLFIKDLKNSLGSIFLRMKPSKWILYKTISISIISMLTLLSAYLMMYILCSISNISLQMGDIIKIIIKNFIYVLLLQNIGLLLFIIFSKLKWILPITVVLILVNIHIIPTNIINVHFAIMFLVFILSHILLSVSYKYLYVNVFENN